MTPDQAIEIAKQFGIKIYTIGIGNPKGGFVKSFFGIQRLADSVDMKLLQKIASQTGGKFFRADNPKRLNVIYNMIDKLEKTKQEVNIFNKYYEAFLSFIWIILLFLVSINRFKILKKPLLYDNNSISSFGEPEKLLLFNGNNNELMSQYGL